MYFRNRRRRICGRYRVFPSYENKFVKYDRFYDWGNPYEKGVEGL